MKNTSKPRGIWIAGNWKMNYGIRETELFFSALSQQFPSTLGKQEELPFKKGQLKACLIPSSHCLEKARILATSLPFPLSIAAQNAHWEKKGAFTGELSGPMLQEIGIPAVLIGHSERRQFFGETDETIRKKTESLLIQGFQIILCIGETQAERERDQTTEVLTRQLAAVFPYANSGAALFLPGQLILAYEPVWAIGTGLTATPLQVEETHRVIRTYLSEHLGHAKTSQVPILYGGSVTPENAHSLLSCSQVDGALVGGASLKPDSFLSLLKTSANLLLE